MIEVKILSDEEYAEFRSRQKRESFLRELEQMSKPSRNSSFSIKNIKSSPAKKEPKEEPAPAGIVDSGIQLINATSEDWGEFLGELSEINRPMTSPVDYITDERMSGFQLDDEVMDGGDKFSKVFKKEISMFSEVLKDVKAHGVRVNAQINKMIPTGKGAGSRSAGVSKGFSDLVEAYNSINASKVQIIKAMADLKAKQVEWQMKDKSTNPSESESVETIADKYYKNIIGGGTKNFVQNSMNRFVQQTDFEYDPIFDEQANGDNTEIAGDPSDIDSMVAGGLGFNPTQPLRGMSQRQPAYINGDEFGNIRHEKDSPDICVYEHGDGSYEFVALNIDGEVIDGIELPSDEDPSILATLKVRPGSDYVYDKYNRKYRIVSMGPVDISDIDDMEYPFN